MKTLKSAPLEVVEHVREYFARELPKKEVISVLRKHSKNAPDNDSELYFVIAKDNEHYSGNYSCWTCWNEGTKVLNSGHYHIILEECFNIAFEFCESVPLTYEAKSGVFIKKDSDLLELKSPEAYSFLINKVDEVPDSNHAFTLNGSDMIIIALKAETEK